jgi:hypothetical protein
MASGLGLDHVGIIARNLDAISGYWERLGFLLTPQSQQMGMAPGKQEPEPWATANRCIMLKHGYIELVGITQPVRYNPWMHFIERFEGMHILAMRCENGNAFYEELCNRVPNGFTPPIQRMRRISMNGSARELRFRNIFSHDDNYPEGRFIVIEHQTPDLLWQQKYMTHANGAVALTEAVVAAREISETGERLSRLTGVTPSSAEDGALTFELESGGLVIVQNHDKLDERYGRLEIEPPAFFAITIAFKDRDSAITLMEKNGVAIHRPRQGRPWVRANVAGGVVLQLEQAAPA